MQRSGARALRPLSSPPPHTHTHHTHTHTHTAHRWEPCSDILRYRHTAGSMLPLHRELLAAGLRALVVSGARARV
jgi:hypothetical protein